MIRRLLMGLSGLFLMSTLVQADTKEPPLFVSELGVDKGSCQDPSAPCRTIDYALKRVGKNGQVEIAGGTFELSDPADAVYMLSGAIDIRGSATERTNLVGVPSEFAAQFAKLGFHVIVDSKGLNRTLEAQYQKIAATQKSVLAGSAATDCVGGFAGVYPCSNVDLLGSVADRASTVRGADIWGFVDLNTHREYAIMAYQTGTAVYDVSDAENPVEVGFIDGQNTTWRDIKVHQSWNSNAGRYDAYAYVTADSSTDGLFIIDLTNLPHSISRLSYASDFNDAHNVYLADTDFSTGLPTSTDTPILILAGSGNQDGRFRSYALTDPSAPSFVSTPTTPANQPANDRLYMHDGASMRVTDGRRNTDCVNAGSSDHCDIILDFNEGSLDIWDITDPADPQRLSRTPYTNSAYSHSGWATEDLQHVFLQDELDERDRGINTTLRVFNVSNLAAPTLQGSWIGPTRAIDHNGFVRGNRYYMSNYSRGLTILDITTPTTPVMVGRFDTYPSGDGVGFPGAWGAYPYLPSGNIAVSDIDSGLYMLRDNTLDVNEGSLSFTADSFAADESGSLSLDVQRAGSSQGAVSVQWEVLFATANGADISTTGGTLNWANADGASKTISIGLTDHATAEDLERIIVRLKAPTGGATLSAPSMASGWISDTGSASRFEFADAQAMVTERGFGKAVAVVHRNGSASGAASVDFAVTAGNATSGSDYTGATNGTVNWADGDANPKWIEFDIGDDGTGEIDEFFELTLSNATGGSLGSNDVFRTVILDGTGANSSPNSVPGGAQVVAGGANVSLDGSGSNDPQGDTLSYAWVQTLGASVTLSGADTATASFTAPNVTSDTMLRFDLTVTDSVGLSDTQSTTVTVQAPAPPPAPPTPPSSGGGGGGTPLWLLLVLVAPALRRVIRKDGS